MIKYLTHCVPTFFVNFMHHHTAPYYEVFAAVVSPLRFFSEALIISEYRCLPEQSGFTFDSSIATNFTNDESSFMTLGLAMQDGDNVTSRSCDGWYWSTFPFFMVGLMLRVISCSLLHLQHRGPQAKKPFWGGLKRNGTKQGMGKVMNEQNQDETDRDATRIDGNRRAGRNRTKEG